MNKKSIQIGIAVVTVICIFLIGRCSVPHQTTDKSEQKPVQETLWTCSMHPEISLSAPGNCPICSMELIPKGGAVSTVSDGITLPLTPRELLRLDLATDTVSSTTNGSSALTLFGTIETDPAAEKTITARVGGRIESFFAAVPGTAIRAGDPIATIYSPELHQLVQELKLSRADSSATGIAIAGSAMERFKLLGFTQAEINGILKSKTGDRITIRADRGGVVVGSMNSMVREGVQVMMGEPLVKLADISRPVAILWLYEKDFAQVKAGSTVNLSAESVPGKTVTAKIRSIDPVIDPMTRAARVRVEIPAGSGFIPGMSISATIAGTQTAGLSIPASAPLITGTRALVYVEKSRNDSGIIYEAREVILGAKTGDRYTILAGLSAGEKVVVRGAFLLDSELQIRGGKSLLSPLRDQEPTSPKPQGSSEKSHVSAPKVHVKSETIVPLYLPIWKALAADNFASAKSAWIALQAKRESFPPAISSTLAGTVPADIESLRKSFAALSKAIIESKTELTGGAKPAYCPMAFGTGAPWIQTGDTIANPFYGSKMLRCGSFTGGGK